MIIEALKSDIAQNRPRFWASQISPVEIEALPNYSDFFAALSTQRIRAFELANAFHQELDDLGEIYDDAGGPFWSISDLRAYSSSVAFSSAAGPQIAIDGYVDVSYNHVDDSDEPIALSPYEAGRMEAAKQLEALMRSSVFVRETVMHRLQNLYLLASDFEDSVVHQCAAGEQMRMSTVFGVEQREESLGEMQRILSQCMG